jgi:hypothetical protein
MDFVVILQAGVGTGTVLLFATLGEILAERSGVLNLGVEGMMLIGAMSAYSVALATGNPWLGVLVAMLAAGLLSQIHAFIAITLQADNSAFDRDFSGCPGGGVLSQPEQTTTAGHQHDHHLQGVDFRLVDQRRQFFHVDFLPHVQLRTGNRERLPLQVILVKISHREGHTISS